MRTFLRTTQDATLYEPFKKLKFECISDIDGVVVSTVVSAGTVNEATVKASTRFPDTPIESFVCELQESSPAINAGLDEILEVGKVRNLEDNTGTTASTLSRFLVNFDIEDNDYPENAKYFLNLYISNASNVNRYQLLNVHPVSKQWIEGSGYRVQDVINALDGCTWMSSQKNILWDDLGGDYIVNVSSSYEFKDIPISDVKIDVTNLMSSIISDTSPYPWRGLIVKFPDDDELDLTNFGNIKFFSGNTHTIFEPRLEVAWDDQVFITGSLKPIKDSNIKITPKNLKQSYTRGEINKIYLVVRDPYPDKRFDATQRYKNVYYLPSASYFRITDSVSGIKIHDFDEYSAINCDPSGSYILLDTTGLDVDRFYKLELKITTEQLVFFPAIEYEFKVETNG
jgi:hypothetical protein